MRSLLHNVVILPFTVVTVLLFGAVIRRILGVRVGAVRTLLAAVLALLAAGPLMRALVPAAGAPTSGAGATPPDTGSTLLLLALSVCAATLLAMIVLVLAEVLVPDGSLPRPIELWHGWRARWQRSRRYLQIVQIAVRHGLGRFLRGRRHAGVSSAGARRELARSVAQAFDEAGVTFVKLGQQLSTRRDLLPEEFVDELARLQDRAAAVPWDVHGVLAAELAGPASSVFEHIDPEPIAAASMAQVDMAQLRRARRR